MPLSGASGRDDVYVTNTGWRVVGHRPAEDENPGGPTSLPPLSAGRVEDTLYAVVVTVEPIKEGRAAIEWVLDHIHSQLGRRGVDVPPLRRDAPLHRDASRFGGLSFRGASEGSEWFGHLVWREVHPLREGVPITTEVTLEERLAYTRLGVRVTADRGLASVRGSVGAGHAQPEFLHTLSGVLEFTWEGGPMAPREVPPGQERDLVRNTLEDPTRDLPVAVLSPTEEDGEFLVDPRELALRLLGRARLYVIPSPQRTYALTDAIGDKRLSCFRGALRTYLPGFTVHDDPYDHPLLVADRLTDPVMLAAVLGQLGVDLGRRLELPEIPLGEPTGAEPTDPPGRLPFGPSQTRRGADRELVREDVPPDSAPPEEGDSGDAAQDAAQLPEASDALRVPRTPEQDEGILALQVRKALEDLTRRVESFSDTHRALLDEVERLRTISAVRSANTSALERRIGALESLLTRAFEPEPTSPPDEPEDSESAEERYTLVDAVRAAGEAHPDTLLILDSAVDAAKESPYEDPELVRATLDAMALVARKRRDGALDTSLREAFGALGVDYRGGIARTTPERLRGQYRFLDREGQTVECVEHIALGRTYDPRRCLRIYFSSRVPSETRFVIGHVGRHFEVITST